MSSTQKVAQWIAGTEWTDLSNEAKKWTKNLILDTIGVTLGAQKTKTQEVLRETLKPIGNKGQSTVIGSEYKISPPIASFINTKLSNMLDFDDCFANNTHFAGESIFPALSVGESIDCTGKDLITAVALGYEVTARFCCGMGPNTMSLNDGRLERPSSAAGMLSYTVLASTTAVSKILDLDWKEIAMAWGIATSAAPMSNTQFDSKSYWLPMVKYNEYGFSGFLSTLAPKFAQKGYTAPRNVFDDPEGFYQRIGLEEGSFDHEAFTKGLGDRDFFITETQIKHYPCCRWSNGPVDLFKNIIEDEKLDPEEIRNVTVKGHPNLGRAAWKNRNPKSNPATQFSVPHCMAMIAYNIEPGPKWHEKEVANDSKIKDFRKKVDSKYNPKFEDFYHDYLKNANDESNYNGYGFKKIPHKVIVKSDENTFERSAVWTIGDSWTTETTTTESQLKDKFRTNARYNWSNSDIGDEKINEIIKMTLNLEEITQLTGYTSLLG